MTENKPEAQAETRPDSTADNKTPPEAGKKDIPEQAPGEIGGPAGPEPTRYGDWEVGGRCTDF